MQQDTCSYQEPAPTCSYQEPAPRKAMGHWFESCFSPMFFTHLCYWYYNHIAYILRTEYAPFLSELVLFNEIQSQTCQAHTSSPFLESEPQGKNMKRKKKQIVHNTWQYKWKTLWISCFCCKLWWQVFNYRHLKHTLTLHIIHVY